MRFKRLLALLLAAALALSVLLAGCKGGGGESLAQVILNLLDGKYQNITVQLDPDLEADLRQAVNEGETDEEIRAALEEILGPGINFRLLGDGQKGDSAWNLILYPGSNPDAAARSAYLEWDKIFSSFPSSGLYTAKLSMIETENGYAILVQATVDKAARRNDDDDEPEEPEDPGYTVDGDGNYTVNTPEGLQELFTKEWSKASNATITLPEGEYNISGTFGDENTPFTGILQGKGKETTTINITDGNGLFAQIGVEGGPDNNGRVENITFKAEKNITNTYNFLNESAAGAVAGMNYGTITGCDVKLDGTIVKAAYQNTNNAGGVVGWNKGNITNCTVTGSDIQADGYITNAGGIAGKNEGGTISGCTVTSSTIIAGIYNSAHAGGIVDYNSDGTVGTVTDICRVENTNVSGTVNNVIGYAYAGGLVGGNSFGIVTGTYSGSGKITATANACVADARAGGLVGSNYNGTVTGTWSGDDGTITAQAEEDGDGYAYEASVPYKDEGDTLHYTKQIGYATAGTKCGRDSSTGQPSPCDPGT